MQVRSVMVIAIGTAALCAAPLQAAEKSVLAGATGLTINNSGRVALATNVPIDYLNRLPVAGGRVVTLQITQPMLCADFAPAPTGNPVGLEFRDTNGDSSGKLYGGIQSFDYVTNGASPSVFNVTADAQLACCIMLPANNATCFQGINGGSGSDGVFSNGYEEAAPSAPEKATLVAADLSVTVRGPAAVAPGASFNYSITVANAAGSVAVSGVRVRDWFPKAAGGFPAPLGDGSWTCSAAGSADCGTPSGVGNIALNAVSLPGGGSVVFNVSRPMGGAASNGAQFSVSAAAFAPPAAGEAVIGNNQDAWSASVQNSAPPTLSNIGDQGSLEDTATGQIAFTADDVDSVLSTSSLSCSSSNPALIDATGCQFSGTEPNFGLVLTPKQHANGSATVTVTVTDGSTQVSDTLVYSVTAVNDAPEFTLAGNVSLPPGTTGTQISGGFVTAIRRGPVAATDETSQAFVQRIITVDSGGAMFSSQPVIVYSGAPETGTLAYGLVENASGTATLRVRMQDNGGTANGGDDDAEQTFTITVQLPSD